MTEAEIDALATKVAIGLTDGLLEILRQHEDVAHGAKRDVSFLWQGHHSVAFRNAIGDLIRGIESR
jgi:hypothetical protein